MIFTSLTDALADMMAEMFYIYIILRFGNKEIIWEDVKKKYEFEGFNRAQKPK